MLEIRSERKKSEIKSTFVYRRIFEANTNIDNTTVITSHDNTGISHSKGFSIDEDYKRIVPLIHSARINLSER